MGASDITIQNIWEDGDATEMGRVFVNGSAVTQAVLTSIKRKIFLVSGSTKTEIGSETTLTISAVIFDTLQTDGRWTADVTGYNFRDRIAGTSFASGDVTNRVEYKFTGTGSEIFYVVYEHPTQEICGS